MKTIKKMLFILLISLSATSHALSAATDLRVKKDPLSKEISQMLSNSGLIIEEEFMVKVLFTVSEEKTISIRSISSDHQNVNQFLYDRLQGQQLKGNNWFAGKIYQLPVKVKSIK